MDGDNNLSNTENRIVEIGDKILFTRHGFKIVGEVSLIKDVSVIVNISKADARRLNIETASTVVSHKHYQILGN